MEHLGKYFIKISNKLKRAIETSLSSFELSAIQSRIILFISDKSMDKNVFQKDVEEEFELRSSSITSTLQNLEKNGYITRKNVPEDQRLKCLVLTEKGFDVQLKVKKCLEKNEQDTFGFLSKEEAKVFKDNLIKVTKNLEKY